MKTHRSFWPYGIIAAFVIFISGTACLIALACSSRSDLVSADYYEQEIRFQGQIDRAARAGQLDQRATVIYSAAENRIRISLPPNHASQNATGAIELYRPSASALDQRLRLETDANGVQTIDAAGLKPGHWRVRVSWRAGSQGFYLDQPIVVKTNS